MKYDVLEPLREHLLATYNKNTARTYYSSVVKLFRGKQFDSPGEITEEFLEQGIKSFKTRNEFSAVKNGLKQMKQIYPELPLPSGETFREISLGKRNYSKKPGKTICLDQVKRKVNQISSRKLKYAYRLAMVSGLRVSELAGLEAGDLTFSEGRISVNVRHGKGGAGGVVECMGDEYLYQNLPGYLKENGQGPLFYSEAYMRQKADELGLECHDFRRIFAITFRNEAKKEMPIQEANALTQAKLRHARFSTTKRYLFNRKLVVKEKRE